jgi:hypothetical protein
VRTLSLCLAGALVTLCGSATTPAAAQDPCANIKVGAPHRVPGRPRPPLVLADSSALLAVAPLVHLGIEANARGCRPLSDAVSIMRARARTHTLPRVVVLVEGADGGINRALLRRALRLVGARGRLGLVTTTVPASAAAAMRAFHRRHPTRTVLIDWAASGIPQRYGGDGLHIGYAGEAALARFIARRVRPFTPPRTTIRFPSQPAAANDCGKVHARRRLLQVLVLRGRSRITCAHARKLATAKSPVTLRHFHYYDWRFLGRPPWKSVFVRNDRRVVVATRTPPAAPPADNETQAG